MNDHLENSNEDHLRKTWSKLLKTTERLNDLEAVEGQIEELQTDKESMKMLLDGNSEEISDLKLSAKKLEVENMTLKKDVAALQKQLEEVKLTAAGDKEEIHSLKAEYKALKKDLEELRCSNLKVYPSEEVKCATPKSETNWNWKELSTNYAWENTNAEKKQCEKKPDRNWECMPCETQVLKQDWMEW